MSFKVTEIETSPSFHKVKLHLTEGAVTVKAEAIGVNSLRGNWTEVSLLIVNVKTGKRYGDYKHLDNERVFVDLDVLVPGVYTVTATQSNHLEDASQTTISVISI